MITFRQLSRGIARWWVLALIVAVVASSTAPVAAQSPPAAPSSVTVTRGDGYLKASWPAVSGATKYHVTYSSDNGASWSLASRDHTTNSITISGVENAKTYLVSVRGGNNDGWGGWTSASADPYESPKGPAAPSSIKVTRGDGYLKASWPAVAGATSYHVTYQRVGGPWVLAALNHPTNSITITDLIINAATYVVGVRARNADGDSGWTNSPPAGPYTPPPPLDAPSSVSITRGDGHLDASWPPVSGATKYHVTYSSDNGASWSLASRDHTTNSITISGVENAKTYLVGVRGGNDAVWGGWTNSKPADPYQPPKPPAAPASVTVTRGDGYLDASWPAVDGATKYDVAYSSDDGATWTDAALDHTTNSITISGADNAETYVVRVRAGNADAWSGWTISASADPYQPPKPPAAPASVTVTRGDGYLDASWPAVDGATKYDVAYSTDDGATWTDAALDHTANSITISSADNAETYVVRVRAGNDHGWGGWTSSASADPYAAIRPPAIPTGLLVLAGDGGVTLTWNDPSDPTITGYEYQVNHNDTGTGNLSGWGDWTAVPNSGADTTRHAIGGLTNGKEYRYKLRAVNAGGASEPAPDNAPWYVAATPGQVARIQSDNDTDNDNLIEVTTVAQFIAMQWDLNGDGTPESETTKYNNAFTSGVSGCSSTCAGYEITADLTITANPTDAGTSYLIPGTWNTTFQGNGNTITNNDSRPLFENIGAASGSTTGEVKSLNVDNSGATNAILADKVQAKGKVTNTGVTGKVTVSGNSTRGGLVNELAGGIISGSHSYADVEVSAGETPVGTTAQWGVGGLVGYVTSGGQVLSSHATGNVTYRTTGSNTWDSQGRRYTGGLVGWNQGTVYASYAWGDVRASENYRSNDLSRTAAGGLIGRVDSGATVRAGYATGSVSRTGTSIVRAHNEFGSAVGESAGTINYVYGSGAVTTSGTEQNPSGTSKQTLSALQTPTGYTGIYANWNFDIDNADNDNSLTTGTDDPWHFGTSTELPVFDYTPQGGTPLPPADLQPASLTLTASSTTIAEGNTTTITASLASSKTYAVRVTQPDGETRYTYDITVAKGSTSATGTFTSVENTSPTSDLSVALTASRTYPTNQVTIVSTSSTIAVQDDEIHNVNNVAGAMSKETDNSYSVTVTWDAPGTENTRNATGYDLDYKISTDATWTTVSISGIATVTHKLTNLTVFRTYEIRMRAKSASLDGAWSSTVSVGVGDDHDADDDGLIDVGNLAQLNAIRYDLNADGAVSSTDETSYLAAFTNAIPGMGCPSTGCTGYELTAALDFDTNNSGGPNAGDTYWNSGAGWQPIGHTATGFSGTFEGNSRAIAGLFINRTSTTTDYFAGLFGEVESGATIRNLVLSDVSVTLTGATSGTLPEVYAGGLAGRSAGTIAGVDVYGTVKGDQPSATGAGKYPNAGGLLGRMEGGSITTSSFTGAVTAEQNDVDDDGASYAGGLVGYKNSGDIWTSFTRGSVKATMSATGNDDGVANAGGLVGYNVAGNIHTAYSLADVNAEAKNAVSGSSSSYLRAGFMAGYWMNGSITNTYGAGRPTVTQPSGGNATDRREGMAGHFNNGTVSDSWFDTTVSGIPDPGFDFNGRGRTTTQMQTPTGYTGDYANWNANVDGVTGNDDPWDFGTASQYPVFKYGRTAGSQRPAVTLSVSPTSICETTKGSNTNACGANPVTSATLTATLNAAQKLPITVTFTPASPIAYSLSAATATIAAGATTASVTVTAVNNYTDAADATVTIGGTVSESWVPAPAGVSLTIKDDDLLAKPTGLKLSVDGTKVRVDWTAVTSATGYTVQWSSSSTFTSPSSAASSTTNHSVTSGLTSGTTYYFRVIANATGYDDSAPSDSVSTAPTTGNVDYDADNDGLIEVSTLAQLNAIRWDLDGNGAVASGDQTNYDTAFPNAEDNMGCNESAVTIASNNTGNPACTGYELSANLDFDTGTAGDRTDDTYYNSGSGWEPIGGVSGSSYTGDFNGNTYTISNLFIDRGSGNYAGLFAKLDGANQTIENVSLVNVDVTFNPSSGSEVYTGGLAGYVDTGVTVEDSYVTGRVRAGESSTDPVTLTASDLNSDVGGLVGRSSGSIISSYSLADVTAHSKSSQTGIATNVGGLVGLASGGSVTASYASGVVSGNTVAQNNGRVHAGGLTGSNNGSVSASYARGDVSGDYDAVATTSVTGRARVGGLVGWQVGNVTASFSTGAPTATGDGTLAAGGLVGAHTGGTNTNSYWDTATSGIADDADNNSPEGKTTSELQTPTAYGTGSSLYANWNLNLDGVTGNDDPWDFGTASQYPVLKYGGQTASQQRVTVTLTASPTTIWERALSASQTPDNTARVNASTLTLTPDSAWDKSIVVTLPASAAVYTLGASTVTFNAGSTTAQTTTMTAVNNYVDAANNAISLAITADSPWVTIGTAPTVTINDDDELTKPAGVKLSVDGTKIRVDWTAVTGATGYKVQWNSTSSTSWTSPSEGTVSSGSTVTYTINPTPALSANTRYYVRVLPTKSGADEPPSDVVDVKTHATGANATVDYDADNDGLIEITTLAQLNAVRWDLDGDGVASSGNETNYATAFPNAEDNMGCNESAVTIASNNTGNPACTGYELRANLDFDTDGDGTADSGDTYWNGGAGWTPIGDFTTAFTATFDGNNDTDASGDGGPYTIANLFINASTTADDATPDIGGLFGRIGKGGAVTNLGLPGVSVTVSSTLEDAIHVGALTADNRGTVTGSWSTGSVTGSTDQNNKTAWISVGGLVGRNDKGGSGDTAYEGVVRAGYSHAAVTGKGRRQANGGEARVGGLVGVNKGTIAASYAAGNVTATNSVSGTELNKGFSGGLVGVNSGTITASYSRGGVNSSATNVTAGGLVGDNESGGTITASFSTGRVTKTVDNTPSLGGLVGANAGSSSFSYWDTETSGQSSSPAGTGKTTSDLQTPTEYGPTASIYHTWNVNVDGVTGDDDPWHFGAANQYPVLKFGAHTAADQRAAVTLSISPATIWESDTGGSTRATTSTLTATLDRAWNEDVAVTVPTNAAYTSSATTITISAGSTTGTATLTAVNNFKCGTSDCPSSKVNNTVALTQATHPTDTKWIVKGTDVSITINDDDELAKPTGVKLTADGTKIRVDWTAVTGATGYKVQWNTSDAWTSPSEGTVSSGNTTNYTINPSTPLTANTRYYVRVLPTKSGADEPPSDVKDTTTRASAGTGDYDADNDGLIEITTLAQLNAMRWDLDGNGVADDAANATGYAAAFPNAEDNMGCNESVVTIASGPGNPPCTGYELRANLNFDTDGDGTADSGDTYWNSGAGWDPIGGGGTAYTAKFDGNSDTDASGDGGPYTIANLFIDRDATTTGTKYYAGLFGRIDTGAVIENVKLTGVSVTLENTTTESPQPEVYAGGLVGYQKAGSITGSSVVGAVKAVVKPVTPSTTTTNAANAGGLVGYKKAGSIISSFARATVTAEQNASAGSLHAHAGGLVGVNDAGDIIASYSAGFVNAKVSGTNGNAYAGGLVGEHGGGDIKATYSYAATTATNSGSSNTSVSLYAAGLVAHQDGGNITASYSTGAPTIAKDGATVTEYKGGLVGRNSSGTTTDGYWDTEKSGVTDTGQGTGKTGSELRTPTAYGTGANDIYKDWDIDLDTTTAGTQDGWDFGTNVQYPVIKYGLTPAGQRVTATLSASPTVIWERALTNPSRVNAATITATLSEALVNAVVVTLPTDDAYTLSSATITIAAGSTTGTTTLTAVNNRVNAANKSVHLDQGATADDPRVGVTSVQATLTINDDDELAAPTNGAAFTPGNVPTTVRVQWFPVTNAAGYKIQYKLTTADTWGSEVTVATTACTGSGGNALCFKDFTSGFTVGSLYDFRVWATSAANSGIDEGAYATFGGGPGVDYDTDDDGMIEITTLAQLNAVRWDLNGDGEAASNSSAYNLAFPSPKDKMGCDETNTVPANRKCIGYELSANLDFNTNGSATSATNPTGADSGDTYWNGGQGWNPIGGAGGGQYTADFDGNSYTISNLFINRTSGSYAGLFAYLNGASDSVEVIQVAIENADVTLNVDATDHVYVGLLAGKSETDITRSYTTGEVNSATKVTSAHKYLFIGGLVGQIRDADILGSYSWADVDGNTSSSTAANRTHAGGLVGIVGQLESSSPPATKVLASYAAGDVTATTGGSNHAKAGGLAGQVGYGGDVRAGYARGDVHGGGGTGNNYRGALAGYQYGNITASFGTGKLTGSHSSSRCGLVGYRNAGSTTDSYYDSSNLGQSGCSSSNGAGKTTTELQTPTAYGTGSSIYANWDLDLVGDSTTENPWDFGTANQYPALRYGGHTLADQRLTVNLTASPTTITRRSAARRPPP